MKQFFRLFIVVAVFTVMLPLSAAEASVKSVKLSAKNFPEPALLAAVSKYDKNSNGYLSDKELRKITSLTIYKYPDIDSEYESGGEARFYTEEEFVFNFKGVDKLAYLESLTVSLFGGYTAEGIHYPSVAVNLECIYNLPGLKKLKLGSLSFESIDLSRIEGLSVISIVDNPVLTLDSIVFSDNLTNITLEELSSATDFHIPGLKNLKKITIGSLNKLESVVFGKSPKLTTVSLFGVSTDNIDLSKLKNLKKIYIENASLKSLSFESNPKLEIFSTNNSAVRKLNLSQNDALKEVYIDGKKVKNISWPVNNHISLFRWSNAGLTELSLREIGLNPDYLEDLILWNNKLTALDISGYYKLNNPYIEDTVEIIKMDTQLPHW